MKPVPSGDSVKYKSDKSLLSEYLLSFRKENNEEEFRYIWSKTFGKKDSKKDLRDKFLEGERIKFRISQSVIIADEIIPSVTEKIVKKSLILFDSRGLDSLKTYYKNLNLDGAILYDATDLTSKELLEAIEKANGDDIEVIVGIGGGQVIDYGNFIAMKTKKFCLAIPTSLATHVYASPKIHAAEAIRDLGYKLTIDGEAPHLALLDINFLESVQEKNLRLIKAGLGDILAFMSAVYDWKLAEKQGKNEVNSVVVDITEDIIKNMGNIEVNKPLSDWIKDYALIQVSLCNITDWVGSPPASGSEHLFARIAEDISEKQPLHGELVAIGTIIGRYLQKRNYKEVLSLMNNLHLPNSLTEIGLSKEETVGSLYKAQAEGVRKGRFTVLDILNLDQDGCRKVIDALIDEEVIKQ